MANETKKLRQAANEVSGSGYLKDYDLKYVTTDNGDTVIKGDITISVDTQKSFKLKVYCPKKTSDGKESKTYPYFDNLITQGEDSDSMQNILKKHSEAGAELTKEQAMAMARKVFVKGTLSPWERLDENDIVHTSQDIRVSFMGDASTEREFKPEISFKCEVFINALKVEKDENEENTGRGILVGTLPLYNGEVASFEAIIRAKDRESVFNNYDAGKTVEIYGIFDVQITEVEDVAPVQLAFGQAPEKSPSTKFKTELVLTGGSVAYSAQNEKSYKREDIEEARAAKMEKLQEAKMAYETNKNKKEESSSTIATASPLPRRGTFNFG